MKNRHREKLCRRCGECCRLKREFSQGLIGIDGDKYCPHLQWLPDGRTNCSVYGQNYHRLIVLRDGETMCVSADEMAKAGLLPESCPYTKEIPNYRCRVIGYKEVSNAHRDQF